MALTLKKKIEITFVAVVVHSKDLSNEESILHIINIADCSPEELVEYGKIAPNEMEELYEIIHSVKDIAEALKKKFIK